MQRKKGCNCCRFKRDFELFKKKLCEQVLIDWPTVAMPARRNHFFGAKKFKDSFSRVSGGDLCGMAYFIGFQNASGVIVAFSSRSVTPPPPNYKSRG